MATKLHVYKVGWIIAGAGSYVPLDPCAGGGYRNDLYGTEIVTCTTAKRAKELVEKCRPSAKVYRPKKLGDV